MNIADIRKEYTQGALNEGSLPNHPAEGLRQWFQEALNAQVHEPNAMVLSTVNRQGRPSSRVVLLKEISSKGLVFFTNYLSRKGQEIEADNHVSVNFFWAELERQVRIEGQAYRIPEADSDAYFQSRPRLSQAGAIASAQSQVIESREELDVRMQALMADDSPLQRPAHWGGYEIVIEYAEFWQGRPGRVHDRIAYFETGPGQFSSRRLSP
ncbi:MAG: pyridoxamine 5'-phosphate oxidase [Bacteroidia bacterium]